MSFKADLSLTGMKRLLISSFLAHLGFLIGKFNLNLQHLSFHSSNILFN